MDAQSVDEFKSSSLEMESGINHSSDEASSNGETMRELEQSVMVLTKIEMDIACSSEKLGNLNVLLMNAATRESDLEASLSVKEEILDEKILEFNFLCGVLDAEINELGNFFCSLQKEIFGVREIIFSKSSKCVGEAFGLFEKKVHDCEESLKQLQEQLDDMKMQSADLQKSLPVFRNHEESNYAQDARVLGGNEYLEDKVQMHTGEQHRNVLRLLEKSLAREMDLDMKLNEARQIEEDLKLKLHTSRQEALFLEEEATNIWAQHLEAENAAVVLMGISKDLLCQLQVFDFKVNCLTQTRDQLTLNLEDLTSQLEGENAKIGDFEGKLGAANCRAETAEARCSLLEGTNSKLNEELNHLKETSTVEKGSMESQIKDLSLKLQHTLAAEEAGQENQIMLNRMVGDMENLINDLKAKVLKAEFRADGAEARCLALSESNAELNDEVNFLRSRLEVLEASARKTNEIKIESAKSIETHSKVIMSLVMQLAMERDRLHQQLLSLAKENKALVARLHKAAIDKSSEVDTRKQDDCAGSSHSAHESNSANTDSDCAEKTKIFASMSSETSNRTSIFPCEAETENARSSISYLETVRTIDAWELNIMHLIVAGVLVLLICVAAYSFHSLNSAL